ncbi:MAG: hypothetical protein ACREJM_10150, partial [Candidatus Saccharimonadales bacterium]
ADLDQAGSDLAERALRYVIAGDDPGVVDALTKAHNPAQQLRLGLTLRLFQTANQDGKARQEFFSTVEPVGPEPYLRLAKVYEAAAKGGPPVMLPFEAAYDWPPWLELFLQEALIKQNYFS